MNNTAYYPDLSMPELIERVRLLQMEGIDGVYLDRNEFEQLKQKFIKDKPFVFRKVTDEQIKEAEFIVIYGMKFQIVESGRFTGQWKWI